MATASLVLGIVGLPMFFALVPSILALVLGLVAWSRAKAAPGPNDGRGRALAGWVLGLVGVVAFLGLIVGGGFAGWYDEDEVGVNELEVGQCVDVDHDARQLSTVPRHDCDEDHGGEVYLVQAVEGTAHDEYPGDESMRRQAEDVCAGDGFEEYVGTPYARSALEFVYLTPTDDSWEQDDRTVICIAVRPDGGTLDESVEGSGR